MSAAPAAKQQFETAKEIAAPADAVEATAVPASGRNVSAWLRLADPRAAFDAVWPPLAGIGGFILLWALLAPLVKTSLGTLPGPIDVWHAFVQLLAEWSAARTAAAEAAAAGLPYAGAPTFVGQIFTSLETVALGFVLASLVAVPLGLVAGMSKRFNAAINPLVQVMRPVSPLAWLPIVTMVVSASMSNTDPLVPKSFVISAVVVMLCSLWPTLINTAIGTASVDKDLINVGRVLRLSWFQRLTRLILPSSLPYIFTGMRLSLGVGWMVLIAAEMLAQNPGLGKFVWDEFQNGSSESLARIMVAVVVIGLIGVLLDQAMMLLQSFVGRNRTV
jgi:nitrate/nitrite transport system permease protein